MFKLISAAPSPFARKVRVALLEKSIPFELITVNPWNSAAKVQIHNPLGKIPILIIDDKKPIYESSYILEWLEAKFPKPSLLPVGKEETLEAKYLQVICDGICEAFVLLFIERMREKNKRSTSWEGRQFHKIEGGLTELETIIPESGFCVGPFFTIADIAIVATVEYLSMRFEELRIREKFPRLASFSDFHGDRPSFKNTIPTPQQLNANVV